MKILIAVSVVVCLCFAIVSCAPVKPKLPETFFARVEVRINDNSKVFTGHGIYSIDQVAGKGVKHYEWDDRTELYEVLRYDLGHIFTIYPGSTECNITTVHPPMPTAWQWLTDASYNGTTTIRGTVCDLWTYTSPTGIISVIAVDSKDPTIPYYFEEVNGNRRFTLDFDHFQVGRVNPAFYDIPEPCSKFAPILLSNKEQIMKENKGSPLLELLPVSVCSASAKCARDICGTCHCPYVWGGEEDCCVTHRGGYDCSGMVQWSFVHCGKWPHMPRTTYQMYADLKDHCGECRPDRTKDCNVGDLFFYYPSSQGPDHVVMYIGDNRVAECPHTGLDCHIIEPYMTEYVGCRRLC